MPDRAKSPGHGFPDTEVIRDDEVGMEYPGKYHHADIFQPVFPEPYLRIALDLAGHIVKEGFGHRDDVADQDLPDEFVALGLSFQHVELPVVLLVQREPRGDEFVGVDLVREPKLLVLHGDTPLNDLVRVFSQPDLVILVVDLFEDFRALVDADDCRYIADHLVLHDRVPVDEFVRIVLVELGVLGELGCEEAAKLVRGAVDGLGGAEGQGEEVEDHIRKSVLLFYSQYFHRKMMPNCHEARMQYQFLN